jgi:hypothetical protein
MALPTDHSTLNYAHGGLPYADQPAKSAVDLKTLDYAHGGLPFFGNSTVPDNATLTATNNVILVTAPSILIVNVERRFPGIRSEDQRVSQYPAHLFPRVGVQDPALIP